MKKLLLMLAVLVTIAACKKDEKEFPDYLIGTWSDVSYNRGTQTEQCEVKFTKQGDDKLKMEVLTNFYAGDVYTINVDSDGEKLSVYTQTFDSGGTITVSGSGYAKNGGFRVDVNRTEDGSTTLVNFIR
jgi:hypothetical protein